ncbi:Uma2 family endonuclease [Streptomyces sp. NBC_01003]|uniref:Uma2 family endonuclease n=1 Tax=Streptomyces sp. NBC_01003 TaxID=2903714 RepID=UPI00386928E0|nr:Uma2 family endonuclease [Streptomyces sp. NBC_01003]
MSDEQRDFEAYLAMRELLPRLDAAIPGKWEITKEGITHDAATPNGPHELTVLRIRKRLEQATPNNLVAHTGVPDVEDEPKQILRRPDVMVIAEADTEGEGAFDPRSLLAAIEVVSISNPENDWVSKMRDYPAMGIPVYVIVDPRTGSGSVLTDIHTTPTGPRYATRKDFVYGETVTIADWTIPTDNLPRYA